MTTMTTEKPWRRHPADSAKRIRERIEHEWQQGEAGQATERHLAEKRPSERNARNEIL
jgi:hypothetical protein